MKSWITIIALCAFACGSKTDPGAASSAAAGSSTTGSAENGIARFDDAPFGEYTLRLDE